VINLIGETVDYLSIIISTMVNLLASQAVILSGELAKEAGDTLIVPLIKGVKVKLFHCSMKILKYTSPSWENISQQEVPLHWHLIDHLMVCFKRNPPVLLLYSA